MRSLHIPVCALVLTIGCDSGNKPDLSNPSMIAANSFLQAWKTNGAASASGMISPLYEDHGAFGLGAHRPHGPVAFLYDFGNVPSYGWEEAVIISFDMSGIQVLPKRGIYSNNGEEWSYDGIITIRAVVKRYSKYKESNITIWVDRKDHKIEEVKIEDWNEMLSGPFKK